MNIFRKIKIQNLNKEILIKRKKSFGLVEVLIAIAISGILMLGAVSVTAKGWRMVKKAELQDASSAILIRALELSRSPVSTIEISKLMANSSEKYFNLKLDDEKKFVLKEAVAGDINKCSQNSAYIVDLYKESNFIICNQIKVKKIEEEELIENEVQYTYEIKSKVVYEFAGQFESDELLTYRKEIGKKS